MNWVPNTFWIWKFYLLSHMTENCIDVLHDVKLIPTSFMTLNWQWNWVCSSRQAFVTEDAKQNVNNYVKKYGINTLFFQDQSLVFHDQSMSYHDIKLMMVFHNQCLITTLTWRWSFTTNVVPQDVKLTRKVQLHDLKLMMVLRDLPTIHFQNIKLKWSFTTVALSQF